MPSAPTASGRSPEEYGEWNENPCPAFWAPHVTLAANVENVGEALQFCQDRSTDYLWEPTVSELVVFEIAEEYEEFGRYGL